MYERDKTELQTNSTTILINFHSQGENVFLHTVSVEYRKCIAEKIFFLLFNRLSILYNRKCELYSSVSQLPYKRTKLQKLFFSFNLLLQSAIILVFQFTVHYAYLFLCLSLTSFSFLSLPVFIFFYCKFRSSFPSFYTFFLLLSFYIYEHFLFIPHTFLDSLLLISLLSSGVMFFHTFSDRGSRLFSLISVNSALSWLFLNDFILSFLPARIQNCHSSRLVINQIYRRSLDLLFNM